MNKTPLYQTQSNHPPSYTRGETFFPSFPKCSKRGNKGLFFAAHPPTFPPKSFPSKEEEKEEEEKEDKARPLGGGSKPPTSFIFPLFPFIASREAAAARIS